MAAGASAGDRTVMDGARVREVTVAIARAGSRKIGVVPEL